VAANAECPGGVPSNIFTVRVNPLPAATVTAKTVCSGGTVTLFATLGAGTTTPMTYTWNIGGTSSTTSDNSKTTEVLTTTTTYTVQLRNANGCVGNVSAPATITVNSHSNPSIELNFDMLSGEIGDASQTVYNNTAITPIMFMVSNATGISLSGNFPPGVSGEISYSWMDYIEYTISGTPTAIGTYGYTLTTTNDEGCTNATASGTITVVPHTLYTASTQTWTFGSQTWTDRVETTALPCSVSTADISEMSYSAPEYKAIDGRYYYNFSCVINNSEAMCPSPWRVPTKDDLDLLQTIIHSGNGTYFICTAQTCSGYYVCQACSIEEGAAYAYLWSTTYAACQGSGSCAYAFDMRGLHEGTGTNVRALVTSSGFPVRCVKD
jgi:uncharacterized protein (TIGR02145 family)